MRIKHLKIAMDRIATSLIADNAGQKMYKTDWGFVEKTQAKQPFVWLITERHSAIYQMDSRTNWLDDLVVGMNHAESSGQEYYLFQYNMDGLYPVFPKTIRSQIKSKVKRTQKDD